MKLKRIINILLIFMIIINISINISNASFKIDNASLYSKGDCGQLLKFKGVIVKTTLVVYKNNETEYPAYCLNKEKDGVGEYGSYTVNIDGVLSNINVWKVIINGYPYKTPSELGCLNEKEAFTATKQAVYTVLYENNIEDYTGIGEAGTRTLKALKQILTNAKNSTETKISSGITINEENNWKVDDINSNYACKMYSISAKGNMKNYKINIYGNIPENTKIVDITNNEKNEFLNNEKFKILIPITNLVNSGEFNIKVESEVNTKPIFIGKAPTADLQNYAITGGIYENGDGDIKVLYNKNETSIKVLKQDNDSEKPLEGAEFDLYNSDKNMINTNLKSDKNGEIKVENLLPGKYFLKETKSPSNYELYEDFIELNVEYNEEITVIVNNKEKEKPKVELKKSTIKTSLKKLPKTGM